jgi:methionyl aminopeptidase
MPVTLKSRQQIARLREAGRLVAETFAMLHEHVVPGATTAELDRIAEAFIRRRGALPIYKGYGEMRGRGGRVVRPAFPATLCTSVNDVICHGIPNSKRLREGDVVGIDVGVLLDGWVGDSCYTYAVGNVDAQTQRLLDIARRCLDLGIAEAHPGKHLGDIGAAIQEHAETHGFSVVREYTGHGVGRKLHDEPTVLHYGTRGTGMRLKPGMVFTIEPMINAGAPDTQLMDDQWTVRTADGSLSAQFEHTIAITEDGPEILTLL